MNAFRFSQRSLTCLNGVHPDLRRLAHEALARSEVDFVVTEGMRSVTRQKHLFNAGATRTMNSRHLTGHAIDVAAWVHGTIRWDWPLYDRISKAFKDASLNIDVPIVWGGDWESFKDGPHFELPWSVYPARKRV